MSKVKGGDNLIVNKRGMSGFVKFILWVIVIAFVLWILWYTGFGTSAIGYFTAWGKIGIAIALVIAIILVAKFMHWKSRMFWFLISALAIFVFETDFFGIPFGAIGSAVIGIGLLFLTIILFTRQNTGSKIIGFFCFVMFIFTALGFMGWGMTIPFVSLFSTSSSILRVVALIVLDVFVFTVGWRD